MTRTTGPEIPDPRWVEELFARGCELGREERGAFLDRECPDSSLRDAVAALLEAHDVEADQPATLDAPVAAALLFADWPARHPESVGPYRVVRTLGEGGMGTVYLAERTEGGFEQQVALKLIKRGMDSAAVIARFRQERQILARLEHPGIARLLDGGLSADGRPYFAMEYVDGESITAFAGRRGLDVEARLTLFLEVCEAVRQAHRCLVVHRDLKPSNILVTAEGRVKLVDFGIAKALAPADDGEPRTLTELGMRPLTPEYASPEQIRGEPVTTAADVYGLGVVLFELLAGRLPHDVPQGGTPERLARLVGDSEPLVLSAAARGRLAGPGGERVARRLRGDLDAIVARALARVPERRYPSVEALAGDLRRHLAGHPVEARRPGVGYRLGRLLRRHRLATAATAAALAALLVGLAGTAWQARVARVERDRAAAQAAKAQAVQEFLTALLESVDPYRTAGKPWTAEQLLDRGVERIEAGVRDAPEVEADLLGVLGGVSRSLGQLERAELLWRRSLAIRRQRFAADSAEVAAGLRGLASVLYARDQHEETAALLEEALAIERRRVASGAAPGRVALAKTLEQLGVERHEVQRLDEARALYEESLALFRALPGDWRASVGELLANLAGVHRAKGELEAAERLYREVVAIENEALGARHPSLAVTLGNYAGLLRLMGDYEGAERLQRQSLAIAREALGEEHPEVTTKISNLAVLLRSRGNYGEAATLLREVLALDRKLLGADHVYVAYSLDNLAVCLAELGAFDEALDLFAQAHDILLSARGSGSADVGTNRVLWAAALRLRGEASAAARMLKEALAIFADALPAGHLRIAGALGELAIAELELGRLAESERRFREALAMRRAADQEEHPDTVELLVGLGRVLLAGGRREEAAGVLAKAARIAHEVVPPGHWRRDAADLALAQAWRATGERRRAAELAAAVAERLAGRAGTRSEQLRRVADALSAG